MFTKTLYHVSYDKIGRFTPRIPQNRCPGENGAIPRICLSDSIEHCINALPCRAEPIRRSMNAGASVGLFVYTFYPEDEETILCPEQISHMVPDALDNHEYWLLAEPGYFEEIECRVVSAEFTRGSKFSGIRKITLGTPTLESRLAAQVVAKHHEKFPDERTFNAGNVYYEMPTVIAAAQRRAAERSLHAKVHAI